MEWLKRIRSNHTTGRLAVLIRSSAGPLELGMFSRTLLLAAGVGLFAGLVGAAFVACVDVGQRFLLEHIAGANLVHAAGEVGSPVASSELRVPWLLLIIPAAGALLGGLLARWAPEAFGGGGDQTIATYHGAHAKVRPRLLPIKLLASVATLASGGAGGREGPAMQLGSSAGAILAEWLPTTARERRLLFVAGIGAGISAVFRTPLGAALLAVEVLYRDDFDAEALVPSVLASVVSFAVSTSILGTRPLFGVMPSHPFMVGHLPFYAVLAVVASAAGAVFVWALHGVRDLAKDSGLPRWVTPGLGGLTLGGIIVAVYVLGLGRIGPVSVESAFLGGGYGLAQMAVADVTAPSMVVASRPCRPTDRLNGADHRKWRERGRLRPGPCRGGPCRRCIRPCRGKPVPRERDQASVVRPGRHGHSLRGHRPCSAQRSRPGLGAGRFLRSPRSADARDRGGARPPAKGSALRVPATKPEERRCGRPCRRDRGRWPPRLSRG
jgi:H+/Cl- antiporter ClcA